MKRSELDSSLFFARIASPSRRCSESCQGAIRDTASGSTRGSLVVCWCFWCLVCLSEVAKTATIVTMSAAKGSKKIVFRFNVDFCNVTVDDLTPEWSSCLWLPRSQRLVCFRFFFRTSCLELAMKPGFCLFSRRWICPFRVEVFYRQDSCHSGKTLSVPSTLTFSHSGGFFLDRITAIVVRLCLRSCISHFLVFSIVLWLLL